MGVDYAWLLRQVCRMSAGKAIGLGLLGAFVGGAVGAGAGLGGGLAYTTLAQTSSFEGYSGFVVAYWLLAGLLIGLAAGSIFGVRRGLSSPPR